MNNIEFKEARKKLELSVNELGVILNTTERTIRRWEANPNMKYHRDPNPIACMVLKWMLEGFRPPEWPQHKL